MSSTKPIIFNLIESCLSGDVKTAPSQFLSYTSNNLDEINAEAEFRRKQRKIQDQGEEEDDQKTPYNESDEEEKEKDD